MKLPKKRYTLQKVAKEWDLTLDDLYEYAKEGELEICVFIEESPYYIAAELERKKVGDLECEQLKIIDEPLKGGAYPVDLTRREWEKLQKNSYRPDEEDGILSWVLLKHPTKKGYLYSHEKIYPSDLVITPEEKERFERTYIKKTPNNKGKEYSDTVELGWRGVVERVYKDLQEKKLLEEQKHPQGQKENPTPKISDKLVCGRLLSVFKTPEDEETDDPLRKKYDPYRIIQQVVKGKIYWRDPITGDEKTNELSGVKDILHRSRKEKRII